MPYQHITVPEKGQAITVNGDGTLVVPDQVAISKAHEDRLATATSDQLEAIALRILDAKTIDEALAG